MSSVEDIIGGAMEEAGLVERSDMGELVGTEEDTPTGETPVVEPAVEGDEPPVEGTAVETKDEKPPEVEGEDDLDKELSSLGVQSKDGKGQESRIRYSKIRKIWDNWKTKHASELTSKHQEELKKVQGQFATRAQQIEQWEAHDRLAKGDPMTYLRTLALVDPRYRQMIHPAVFGQGQPAQDQAQEQMPGPDATFPDGTKGYSPEGFQKALEWHGNQLSRRIEQRMQQQYGQPIQRMQQGEREAAERQMHISRVQNNVEMAKQAYGQAFVDDFGSLGAIKPDSAIVKTLRENPNIQFLEACALALIPKIQADRNRMHQEILEEQQRRPAAARRSTPAAAAASASSAPQTTEQIIEEQMRRNGLI